MNYLLISTVVGALFIISAVEQKTLFNNHLQTSQYTKAVMTGLLAQILLVTAQIVV